MTLIDIIGLGVSSIIMVVLSKSKLHMKSHCCSYAYNDHNNVDISKLNEEKENNSDDEPYDDLPVDSFRTQMPPVAPKIPALPLSRMNLQTLKK